MITRHHLMESKQDGDFLVLSSGCPRRHLLLLLNPWVHRLCLTLRRAQVRRAEAVGVPGLSRLFVVHVMFGRALLSALMTS